VGASQLYLFGNLFASWTSKLSPNVKIIAPPFLRITQTRCDALQNASTDSNKYRFASSFIQNESLVGLKTRLCKQTVNCKSSLYGYFATINVRSAANYVLSQLLLGGGDFQEKNIVFKTTTTQTPFLVEIVKIDLDVSFRIGGFKRNEQSINNPCDAKLADAIYSPQNTDYHFSWTNFKKILVYDANLLFLSPKRCQWAIDNHGNIGFHSDTGQTQINANVTYGKKQPACRQDILNDIDSSNSLSIPQSWGSTPEELYCKFVVNVLNELDTLKESLICNNIRSMSNDFNTLKGVAKYLNEVFPSSTSSVCTPTNFAENLETWVLGQCQGLFPVT
jgi:hypothetical protein